MTIELNETRRAIAEEAREKICACIAGSALKVTVDLSVQPDKVVKQA